MDYIVKAEPDFYERIRDFDDGELRDLRAVARWLATIPDAGDKESRYSRKGPRGFWWRSYEALDLIVFFRLQSNVITFGVCGDALI